MVVCIRDRSNILIPTPRVSCNLARISKERDIKGAACGAAAPLALLSASMKRAGVTKTVALTHGHEVWWAKVFPFTWAFKRIGSTVDTLTYLGEFTQRAISHSLSVKASQAMVKIAPGIDVDHFTPVDSTALRKELGVEDKKVIVLGRQLVHRKAQDHLIEAMPELLNSVLNAHLFMFGKGPYLALLPKSVPIKNLENPFPFFAKIK